MYFDKKNKQQKIFFFKLMDTIRQVFFSPLTKILYSVVHKCKLLFFDGIDAVFFRRGGLYEQKQQTLLFVYGSDSRGSKNFHI